VERRARDRTLTDAQSSSAWTPTNRSLLCRSGIPRRTRTQTHRGHESSSRMTRVGTSERRRRSPSGLSSRASVACAVEQVADPEIEQGTNPRQLGSSTVLAPLREPVPAPAWNGDPESPRPARNQISRPRPRNRSSRRASRLETDTSVATLPYLDSSGEAGYLRCAVTRWVTYWVTYWPSARVRLRP
jgi:hypothetical protein